MKFIIAEFAGFSRTIGHRRLDAQVLGRKVGTAFQVGWLVVALLDDDTAPHSRYES